MGFSVRRRTKGKSSWFNFSASKSRGMHASYSQKLGNLTLNFSKRGRRATYNFGNGIRYTSYQKTQPIVLSKTWVFLFVMFAVIILITLY